MHARPVLTAIENLSAIEYKIYVGCRYSMKIIISDIRNGIEKARKKVNCKDIESLTNSLDKRVTLVLEMEEGIGM